VLTGQEGLAIMTSWQNRHLALITDNTVYAEVIHLDLLKYATFKTSGKVKQARESPSQPSVC
jgi:hypothetical protein